MKAHTRFLILRRDGFTCQYCGKKPPEVSLEVDHIVPRSKGGSDDDGNLITACFDCNRGKLAKDVIHDGKFITIPLGNYSVRDAEIVLNGRTFEEISTVIVSHDIQTEQHCDKCGRAGLRGFLVSDEFGLVCIDCLFDHLKATFEKGSQKLSRCDHCGQLTKDWEGWDKDIVCSACRDTIYARCVETA